MLSKEETYLASRGWARGMPTGLAGRTVEERVYGILCHEQESEYMSEEGFKCWSSRKDRQMVAFGRWFSTMVL